MAGVLQKLKRREEAISKFEDAALFGLNNEDLYISGWAYHHIGEIFQEKDHLEQACIYFQKSDHIWRQIPHLSPHRANLTSLGRILLEIGQYEKAIETFTEALKITIQMDDKENIGDCYIELAEAFQKINQLENALSQYQLAQQNFKATKNSQMLRLVNYRFSQIYQARSEWEKAISYYVDMLSDPGNLSAGALGDIYWYLGDAYSENKQLEFAIESYQKGLEKYTVLSDQASIVSTALGMASAYGKLELVEKEIDGYKMALETAEKAQLKDFMGSIQKWLADSYFKAAVYDQALKYYQLSLDSYEESKDTEESVKGTGKDSPYLLKIG